MKASEKANAIIGKAIADQADGLSLQGLGLASLPPIAPGLRYLRHLNLSSNRLASLAEDAWHLDELWTLDIGSNQLKELPPQIATSSRLQALDASENRLSRLPAGLATYYDLRELRLYGNELTDVEPACKLPKLEVLDLSGNRLRSVGDLGGLVRLRELDLSGNLLEVLPGGLENLTGLRRLDVSGNSFVSIASFETLQELEELVVDEGLLTRMPADFLKRRDLNVVSAANGSLVKPANHRAASALLRDNVRNAIATHTKGGPEDGKQYFDYPPYVFEFLLAIGGISGALRIVDLYYKRFHACCTATFKFPGGEVVELRNLTRKAAMAIVSERREALEAGDLMLDMREASDERELQRKTQLVVEAVSSLPKAALVPKDGNKPTIQFINYDFHAAVGVVALGPTEEIHMGDKISFGDVHGSIVNVKSTLTAVHQVVQQTSHLDEDVKRHWQELLAQLSKALEAAPAKDREDAQAVADAAAELVAKAAKDAPNKKSVSISAAGLLEAAKGIAAVVPIAAEIVRSVTDFVTGQ